MTIYLDSNLNRNSFQSPVYPISRSAYQRRQLDESNEAVKQPQRDRILDYFLRYRYGRHVRLLSMPGVYWRFEKQLNDALNGELSVIGLEREWSVIEVGRPHMLGGFSQLCRDELKTGCLLSLLNHRARWALIHAESLFRMGRSDKPLGEPGHRQIKWFSRVFKKNTHIWLDVNTNFSTELMAWLPRIGNICFLHKPIVPLALTFIMGQDAGCSGGAKARVEMASKLINTNRFRGFELDDYWSYESVTGCHMVNMLGRMILK